MNHCSVWSGDFPILQSAGGTVAAAPQTAPPERGNTCREKSVMTRDVKVTVYL